MWLDELWRRLRIMTRRREFEADLEEEMRLHLDLRAEDSSDPWAARRRFGNTTQIKEASREMWTIGSSLGAIWQDAKYGLRSLARTRGFAMLAVLTLALGIGSSVAVFSVVNTILLAPLPYPQADRMVIPWVIPPKYSAFAYDVFPWSPRQFRILRTLSIFDPFGAFKGGTFNLTGQGDPVSLKGVRVSYGFFPAVGISPALGRWFTAEEDQPGRDNEVMLSDRLWRERFSADPAILGRSIDLDGQPHTVIGVMPAGFAFPHAEEMPDFFDLPKEAQVWVPLAVPPAPLKPEPSELAAVARLRAGVTPKQAQAAMDADFTARLEREFPQYKGFFNTKLTPLATQMTAQARTPLLLILGAVALVLLIASANVANLLLARSLVRKREFALRAALGAGSGRLMRQVLTESLVLALAGGVAGLAVGQAGIQLMKALGPGNLTHLQEVTLDARVFAFGLAVSLVTGILFGLAPAIGAARSELAESLKESGSRTGGSASRTRLRSLLVIGEVALALVLVIAAGLLTRTFIEMLRTNPGFRPEHVLTFELTLPALKYPDQTRMARVYMNAMDRLRSEPGIEAAGLAQVVPMGGSPDSTTFRVIGRPLPPKQAEQPYGAYTVATPGFFAALGVPILRGRDLAATDTADSTRVVVINTSMALKFFGGEDPIGKQMDFANNSFPPMTVVGIVGDVKQESLGESPMPRMYAPVTQKTWTPLQTMQVALRTRDDPSVAAGYAREAIRSVDPQLPVSKLRTMAAVVDDSLARPRFAMVLVGAFGVFALALASIGTYGVVSYFVRQRTREIGVRMALGAGRADVLGMVVGEGVRLAGIGVALGIGAALAATPLMARFLYGVRPADPVTFIGLAALLIAITLAACFIPARRAMRLDPNIALREE